MNNVQVAILIQNRDKLLKELKQRDEIIEFLLDELEEAHSGWSQIAQEEIAFRWGIEYK